MAATPWICDDHKAPNELRRPQRSKRPQGHATITKLAANPGDPMDEATHWLMTSTTSGELRDLNAFGDPMGLRRSQRTHNMLRRPQNGNNMGCGGPGASVSPMGVRPLVLHHSMGGILRPCEVCMPKKGGDKKVNLRNHMGPPNRC